MNCYNGSFSFPLANNTHFKEIFPVSGYIHACGFSGRRRERSQQLTGKAVLVDLFRPKEINTVSQNGRIDPKFFRSLKEEKETRVCTVYYDFGGSEEKKYEFKIPIDVYFDLLDHSDYTTYMEEECIIEFSKSQMQLQNPQTDMTLYMKKGE